jgi:putative radical SAM enzyme (TIGR03279 family)
MKKKEHLIVAVEAGSIAEELEIKVGDSLISINNEPIEDIFDFHYSEKSEYLELTIKSKDGEIWVAEVDKDEDENIGLTFESSLMDEYRSCRNNCVFCFIDQMPQGMRETLYFKDDDTRLSFLQGNYVTLTNMNEQEIERIIKYRLSPINLSVHTTNLELRKQMLNNRFADKILEYTQKLYDADITMNAQIVLCKGYNDGTELEKTIKDLSNFAPQMQSLSIVPVGLTKYREGLAKLEPFSKDDALDIVNLVEKYQQKILDEKGTHFVHASDEFYILAGKSMPNEDTYDGYLQLENGVGMTRLFVDEFIERMEECKGSDICIKKSLVTGMLFYPTLLGLVNKLKEKFPNLDLTIYPIRNDFFGERITVTGLITGQDIINQLKGKDLGDTLLLPNSLLRSGETVLLDDITVDDIEKALQVAVSIVKSNGCEVVDTILNKEVTR